MIRFWRRASGSRRCATSSSRPSGRPRRCRCRKMPRPPPLLRPLESLAPPPPPRPASPHRASSQSPLAPRRRSLARLPRRQAAGCLVPLRLLQAAGCLVPLRQLQAAGSSALLLRHQAEGSSVRRRPRPSAPQAWAPPTRLVAPSRRRQAVASSALRPPLARRAPAPRGAPRRRRRRRPASKAHAAPLEDDVSLTLQCSPSTPAVRLRRAERVLERIAN